jgi:hypothetical protein
MYSNYQVHPNLSGISTSNYISKILPRPSPSLESFGIQWQNSQQYFTAISEQYMIEAESYNVISAKQYVIPVNEYAGRSTIFRDDATLPDEYTKFVHSICANHTASQIWWLNTTIV